MICGIPQNYFVVYHKLYHKLYHKSYHKILWYNFVVNRQISQKNRKLMLLQKKIHDIIIVRRLLASHPLFSLAISNRKPLQGTDTRKCFDCMWAITLPPQTPQYPAFVPFHFSIFGYFRTPTPLPAIILNEKVSVCAYHTS